MGRRNLPFTFPSLPCGRILLPLDPHHTHNKQLAFSGIVTQAALTGHSFPYL